MSAELIAQTRYISITNHESQLRANRLFIAFKKVYYAVHVTCASVLINYEQTYKRD